MIPREYIAPTPNTMLGDHQWFGLCLYTLLDPIYEFLERILDYAYGYKQ